MTLDTIVRSFSGGSKYLNTTHYGLWPIAAVEDMRRAASDFGNGSFDTAARDASLESSRQCFAQLVGVAGSGVAVGHSVSPFVGLVASSIPEGSKVLVVEDDFTSLTMPFVVHSDRLKLVRVSVEEFVDAVDESIDVAVVSAVQSANGTVIDLDALAAKRQELDVRIILDVTQAAGWLPINAGRFDVVVAAAYKWLLCPRGVAFSYFSEEMIEAVRPIYAGWYSAKDIHTGYYGTDVELASSARKFDISPSGINWIGAAPALSLLAECGVENINIHNTSLANQFRRELHMPVSNSAIVTLPISPDAIARLNARGIRFGVLEGKRAGYARFAFHLYNTAEDAAEAAASFQ
jgi:selenocysteine lyase/cysteine desulfurase